MPLEKDSVQIKPERQILFRQLLPETLYSGSLTNEFNFSRLGLQKTPLLFTDNFRFNEIFNPLHFHSAGINVFSFMYSPFLREETVFNGAIYKLSNKVNLGGYSFGANSIFSAPLPNQRMNNFDTRGATMFLQYNVSKNFRIETRVNVRQGYAPIF